MNREQVELDILTLEVKARPMGGPAHDLPKGAEYTIFDLRLHINGIDLISPDSRDSELEAIDDSQLWLAQRYNRGSWLLTCSCGTPECAGFYEPVATRRGRGRLTWTFPESYFQRLRARGLVSGGPRPVTFTFDAKAVYEQFEAAQEVVRQYEAQSGKPSAFSAGCHSKPDFPLAEQYERAEAWYLRRNKQRRYARHLGLPPGVCAGAPSINGAGNVK